MSNKQHYNYLKIYQINILIAFDENTSLMNQDSEKLHSLFNNHATKLKNYFFNDSGSLAIMSESHQININISGKFAPNDWFDDYLSSELQRKWHKEHKERKKNNLTNLSSDQDFIIEYIQKNFVNNINYSIMIGKMNFLDPIEINS